MYFHQRFEAIHPFQDGNGRIGRFVILKQCIENNIDLVAIDDEYNKEYKGALYIAQVEKNIEPLVDIFKKCQEKLDRQLGKYKLNIEELAYNIESDGQSEGKQIKQNHYLNKGRER